MKNTIKNYLSLVTFSHTIFALPFAVIGFFLGSRQTGTHIDLLLLLKILLCMVFARSAAMSFNRYADRLIDSHNERTKKREIPSGIISPASALGFVVLSSLFFVLTTFTINTLCFYLSPVALIVVLGYSYTKRFTWLCHLVLGLGLSLAPIGAYLAVTGKFDWLPLFFACSVLCWVSGFDIIYALQDEEFDKVNRLFSIPSWLGKRKALVFSSVLHVFSAFFILLAGITAHAGLWYWTGCGFFMLLLIYQHTLVKPADLSKVNLAFFTTNGIASVVFSIFVVVDLLTR